MKTITKITTQKKSKNRYNIFLDDQYAFSVSEDMLIQHHLHKGLQLSEDEVQKIVQSDEKHRYYTMAIRYLSYRMRSAKEVHEYLVGKEVHLEVIDEIIEKLKREKLLNDKDFARAFLHDRIHHTSKGPIVIANELREKGVHANIVEEVMGLYSYEEQFEKASKFADKQLRRKSNHSYQKRLEQLKIKLMQKGFPQDVVKDVVAEMNIEKDPNAEFDVLVKQAEKMYRRYRKKHTGYELIQKLKAGLYARGFDSESINKYVENLDESM